MSRDVYPLRLQAGICKGAAYAFLALAIGLPFRAIFLSGIHGPKVFDLFLSLGTGALFWKVGVYLRTAADHLWHRNDLTLELPPVPPFPWDRKS